jgi:hypothetical protein
MPARRTDANGDLVGQAISGSYADLAAVIDSGLELVAQIQKDTLN